MDFILFYAFIPTSTAALCSGSDAVLLCPPRGFIPHRDHFRNRAFCAAWHGSHQNRLGLYSPLHKHSKERSQLAPVAVLRHENRCIAPQLYTTIQGRRTGCPPTSDGGVLQAATSVCTLPNLQGSQIHPHTNGQDYKVPKKNTVNKFQSTTMNYKITQKNWLKNSHLRVTKSTINCKTQNPVWLCE